MLGRKYPRKHTSSQNKALVKASERFRSLLIKDYTGNGSSWKDVGKRIRENELSAATLTNPRTQVTNQHSFRIRTRCAKVGRFSSHVTETRTWVIHVKWMKGTDVAMLCLVTRNKQKHKAKGPNLVKDEATRA